MHIQQINPFSCGAACMQMVYLRFGLNFEQDSLFNSIAESNQELGIQECCPNKMQQHFHGNGFAAGVHLRVADILDFLLRCQKLGLSVIINFETGQDSHHFVLFDSVQQSYILVYDPAYSAGPIAIDASEIINPQCMLIAKASHKVVCPSCKTAFPSNNALDEIMYARRVSRCSYCINEIHGVGLLSNFP